MLLTRDNIELRMLYEQVETQQLVILKNGYLGELLMEQLEEVENRAKSYRFTLEAVERKRIQRVPDKLTWQEASEQGYFSLAVDKLCCQEAISYQPGCDIVKAWRDAKKDPPKDPPRYSVQVAQGYGTRRVYVEMTVSREREEAVRLAKLSDWQHVRVWDNKTDCATWTNH